MIRRLLGLPPRDRYTVDPPPCGWLWLWQQRHRLEPAEELRQCSCGTYYRTAAGREQCQRCRTRRRELAKVVPITRRRGA